MWLFIIVKKMFLKIDDKKCVVVKGFPVLYWALNVKTL